MDNPFSLKLRWRGFAFLGFCALAFLFYVLFFMDWHLKKVLENYATSMNGARVDIQQVQTRLLAGKIDIYRVQFTELTAPTRNLFEIDKISCRISFLPLLRKKLVIESLNIEGVRTGTSRDLPGLLPIEITQDLPTSLSDRVATGLYTSLRARINENPLKLLGQLSSGVNLQELITEVRKDLPSFQTAKQIETALDTAQEIQPTTAASLAVLSDSIRRLSLGDKNVDRHTIQRDLASAKHSTEQSFSEVKKLESNINENTAALNTQIEKDLAFLKAKLLLPNLEQEDLTPSIIGPKFLEWMERLSYWVDVTRRKMPIGTERGLFWTILQSRNRGHSVHFGKHAGTPTFLIQRMTVKSTSAGTSSLGDVTGYLNSLTSDPSILGNPTVLHLEAQFLEKQMKSLKLDITIDHSKKRQLEKLDFNVKIANIGTFPLSDVPDLKLRIDRANLEMNFAAEFLDDDVKIEWNGTLTDVQYTALSRFKQIEEIITHIVNPVLSFDISGSLSGPSNNPSFTANSTLGKRLAEGLRSEFRHQMGAIDDMLQQNLMELLSPVQHLDVKLDGFRRQMRQTERDLEKLQLLESQLASTSSEYLQTARKEKRK